MADTFALRTQRDRVRADADAARASADERLAVVRRLQDAARAGDQAATPSLLAAALAAHAELHSTADQLATAVQNAEEELTQALDAGAPLFSDNNTDPIALLPVRVETIWWEPSVLRVRVYPDDLLVSAFTPELTPTEAAAAAEYWRDPGQDAWQRLLTRVRPARAAWAAHASRPGSPPPTVRPEDPEGRRHRTVTMPKRWRFLGLLGGEVVEDKLGRPVPDPLPVGMLRSDEEGWETDWFEALKAGMAVELTLAEGIDHLDALLVVGVREASAQAGAAQLGDLLLAHAYGAGLGVLPAGTPTNNTPRTRSGWTSAPTSPAPDPGGPEGPRPAADALAAALGLPDATVLRAAPGASDADASALEALSLLTWPTLGKGFAEAAVSHLDLGTRQRATTDPARPWRAVRDHLAEHVRGRGPLPVVRVGRQPYGVLPATALGDWRAERDRDADALLAPWLQRLRERWRAVLAEDAVPHVRPGEPVDQVTVDALQRSPVATGLAMRRLDGPGFAVPKAARDEPATRFALPGLAPDGELRWTTRSDGWTDLGSGLDEATGTPAFVGRLTPDPQAFPQRARNTADYLLAVRTFLAGELEASAYDEAWPVELASGRETPPRRPSFFDLPAPSAPARDGEEPPVEDGPLDILPEAPPDATGLLDALLFLPNWAFMDGDEGEDDPLRRALWVTGEVDQLVADVLEGLSARDRAERVAELAPAAHALARLEDALRTLAGIPTSRLPELLCEVIDVYSHRLDAWVTSLATRRLAELRADGVAGVRYGCYGWVEHLPPPLPAEQVDIELAGEDITATVSEHDGYIHAPSLHHAATAAVLRSGFLGHPGHEAYAVNLTSRRARIARWLLGAVRRGQNLGSLLGYRFERSLHDAELDHLIERFRRQFPLPVVPEPEGDDADPDLWSRSAEVIAARNVVDGMALLRTGTNAVGLASVIDGAPLVPGADQEAVAPLLEDVIDALDAVGDLLLAESVHQLVGGNPIRAGLAADTLGRGEEVPDAFHVLRTPHRARAITHRVAALFPAAPEGSSGWPGDPLAALQPALEWWVAHLLGPASGWAVAGVLHLPGDGVGAEAVTVTADRLGLGALTTVLDAASADPSVLRHAVLRLIGAEEGATVTFKGPSWIRLTGLATRIRSLLGSAQPFLPAQFPGNPPDAPVGVADLQVRLAAFAATLPDQPAASTLRSLAQEPPGPGGAAGWLARARAAISEVLGADLPLLPAVPGPVPHELVGLPGAALEDWLRRNAGVRPAMRTLHETLLLKGAASGRPEPLRAAQDPHDDADPWIGGTFPTGRRPRATVHLAWHAPSDLPPGAPLAGVLLDEWVELLPGTDLPAPAPAGGQPEPIESELTGVAFHFDRPDAKAPHAILIAVPPNLERGWTSDGLAQVLLETLELAKLRALDLLDLGPLSDLLPAIRISPDHATGAALARIETRRPNTDPAGPFRLEPGHRTDEVEFGLAARVHDPLWMLTRQWQFGEFTGQDAGSPAVVSMAGDSAPIDAWRPVGQDDWVPYDLGSGPLDAEVEDEPVRVDARLRAEGGAALLRMLDDGGLLAAASGVLEAFGLGGQDLDGSLVGLLGSAVPDAAAVAAALDAGTFGAGADPAVGEVARRWRGWWAGQVAERGPDCFDPHRFEHAVDISTRGTVLHAEEYLGDGLDWYSLDIHPDADVAAAPAAAPQPFADEGLPSLVHYGGLPADRFWQMEDAQIDLGATELSTLDTGRLLLISFATVFGNDWFLVPLEVPVGSLTILGQLVVRDVFGRHHLVERAGRGDASWSLFTLHSADPDHAAASGLLILPTERGQTGAPLESVSLARDELANLAWAVQHHFTDGRGERVDRRDRWLQRAPEPLPPGELPAYGVQTLVPDYWFPLVPESVRPGAIRFRLGQLTGPGLDAHPEGRLIERGLWVHEEEVPRDGAGATRRPVLARWFDGSWHSWVRRQKHPGAGETSSGLAFDTVRPTEPWPD